jgi:ketosteroid isomerase-like protein
VSAGIVRELFERYNAGGVESALELLSEDFVAVVPPSMSAEPDVYEGHDGARRYFAGFEGMLEDVSYEALELIPEGEHVLVRARLGGRGASSGLEVDLESVVVHTVEGGKITRIVPHPDLESARDALAGNAE